MGTFKGWALIIGLFLTMVGIVLVTYSLNRPCDYQPLTQTVGDQEIVIDYGEQMGRLMCLSTDLVALLSSIIGTSLVFGGIGLSIHGLKKIL